MFLLLLKYALISFFPKYPESWEPYYVKCLPIFFFENPPWPTNWRRWSDKFPCTAVEKPNQQETVIQILPENHMWRKDVLWPRWIHNLPYKFHHWERALFFELNYLVGIRLRIKHQTNKFIFKGNAFDHKICE